MENDKMFFLSLSLYITVLVVGGAGDGGDPLRITLHQSQFFRINDNLR